MNKLQCPDKLKAAVTFAQGIFPQAQVPLHRPVFEGNERRYLDECITSNFVSSVGARVTEFEERIADFVGSKFAIATVNGTAALHASLLVAGAKRGNEILSQSLTFVATCNAISYIGGRPVFIDVDRDTLGMSPSALRRWIESNTRQKDGRTINVATGATISACVPMHTFGIPVHIAEIASICDEFGITLIEDAAESLGSYVGNRHTGTFGQLATLSFNGNKIITTGGGGMIVTDDPELAKRAKHLTTTAKVPHSWEFIHDEIGYNYRMPNLNAALGCAQMEALPTMLEIKAEIAARYRAFCAEHGLTFINAPEGTRPNNWLNALQMRDVEERNAFLEYSNAQGVMTRPIWKLMSELEMFKDCQNDGLENSRWLADRIVNIPSSVPESEFGRLRNGHT